MNECCTLAEKRWNLIYKHFHSKIKLLLGSIPNTIAGPAIQLIQLTHIDCGQWSCSAAAIVCAVCKSVWVSSKVLKIIIEILCLMCIEMIQRRKIRNLIDFIIKLKIFSLPFLLLLLLLFYSIGFWIWVPLLKYDTIRYIRYDIYDTIQHSFHSIIIL